MRHGQIMFNLLTLMLVCGHVLLAFQNDEDELLKRTLDALHKSLDFILNNSENMNVDGVLGVNIANAHLSKALLKTKDPTTAKKLMVLISKANLNFLELQSYPYKYYVFNNYVIPAKLWERDIEFSYGKLNSNPKVYPGSYNVNNLLSYTRYVTKSTFSEEQSDACFVEVATASDDTKPHDCPVSDACVDYMLTMPTNYSSRLPGYGVTHMAIFLQIGRNRNCNFDYDKVNKLLEDECSYILWELRQNVQFGYIPNLDDLFIEQIDVCGLEGFGEFLQKDYLEHILKAQNPHGGFGVKRLTAKQLLNYNRPKRESFQMQYGANSHTTGLAVSVLALYARLLIEKPFNNKAFYEAQ